MILSPLLSLQLRPKLCGWFKQTRNIRPNIKIGKDKFQLELDVRNFSKDEIRVKARPEYVIIEGKQEKKTKQGMIMRQFVRKFKLPAGCTPENIESKLSPDGVLTITAARKVLDPSLPCETLIPISTGCSVKDKDASFVPVQENPCSRDVCAPYMKKVKSATDSSTSESEKKPKT